MDRNEILETVKNLETIHNNLDKQFCRVYNRQRTCEECPFYDEQNKCQPCHLDHLHDIIHNLKYHNY